MQQNTPHTARHPRIGDIVYHYYQVETDLASVVTLDGVRILSDKVCEKGDTDGT